MGRHLPFFLALVGGIQCGTVEDEEETDLTSVILTPRLLLRPGEARDGAAIAMLSANPRVAENLAARPRARRQRRELRRGRAGERGGARRRRLRPHGRAPAIGRGRHLARRAALGPRLRHRGDAGRGRPRLLRRQPDGAVVLQPGQQRPRPPRHREMRLPVPRDRHDARLRRSAARFRSSASCSSGATGRA